MKEWSIEVEWTEAFAQLWDAWTGVTKTFEQTVKLNLGLDYETTVSVRLEKNIGH